MRVVLIGADFEENLGIAMIAAVTEAAGHQAVVVPFDTPESAPRVVATTMLERPDVIGLGIQFQHRAADFLDLADALRRAGFTGHLTCGGQYPTLAWEEVLRRRLSVDTVVMHDGEHTFADLLVAVEEGRSLTDVHGLALLQDGVPTCTPGRPLPMLDALPFPKRYRPHTRHLGVPFIPLVSGRGCWGSCAYCSITSYYRGAKALGGGKMLRRRSPQDVATEMAMLAHSAGDPAIFCFHDDNFLCPRPDATLERIGAIRSELDALGVGKAAMIGKGRPDSVTPELARELADLGVIRMYIGVENASEAGARHLGRGRQNEHIHTALEACRDAGIFVCYNLLIFEPDAKISDIEENIAFIRAHAEHPVNFCRAEPYYGTPLLERVLSRSAAGSYLGFTYQCDDPDVELLFRICAAAFRTRNFDPNGVANRNMGLGYLAKILEYFHGDPDGEMQRRASELTRSISMETAHFLDDALAIVREHLGDHDAIARHTALLGLRIAEADRGRHKELDALITAMDRRVAPVADPERSQTIPPRLAQLARRFAFGAAVLVTAQGCDSCGPTTVDPVPADYPADDDRDPIPVDPPPPPQEDIIPEAQKQPPVVDPPPPPVTDPVPHPPPPHDPVPHPVDMVPPPVVPPPDPVPPPVVDPLPGDPPPMPHDPVPRPPDDDGSADIAPLQQPVDHWRETSARVWRSDDLALFDPPRVSLEAEPEGDAVRVTLVGGPERLSIRWESQGRIEGSGRSVIWRPLGNDQITAAVRSDGGVAVVSRRG